MQQQLAGKKVDILVTNGFEQSELTEPKRQLEAAGVSTTIVSPEPDDLDAFSSALIEKMAQS